LIDDELEEAQLPKSKSQLANDNKMSLND